LDEQVAQAESLLDAGQIGSAIRILETCRERAPERVDILESLAFAYAAQDDPVLASLTFIEIAELVPERAEYLLYAAESLLEADDPKGAVDQYQAYLDLRPDDRAVWVTLADLEVRQGQLNKALEALLEGERIEERASQQLKIGELYLRKDNLAQAQAWFARALNGGSEFRDEALLGLLETAVRARRFADAEALLERIEAEFPGRLEQSPLDGVQEQLAAWRERQDAAAEALAALDERGLSSPGAERGGEPPADASTTPVESPREEARVAVPDRDAVVGDEAVSPVPGDAVEETETAAATGYRPQRELEAEAGPAAEPTAEGPSRPVAIDPEDGDYLARARAARDGGEILEAIRLFKRALIVDDSRAPVWAELSELYLETGNDRWAQATASEAMRREPDNPKMVLQFLRAAQRTMEDSRLIREMESAYRQFPEQPEIILVLARAYADVGNSRNARLLYRRFLDRVPPDHPARDSAEGELARLGG
jgi:thioredoxin-like negative regulator of GroEL